MKITRLLASVSVLLFVSACSNDDSISTTTEKKVTTTEVTESSAFDWSTDKAVSVTITASATTPVSIYADEACTTPIVTNKLLKENVATDVEFTVPSTTETAYVAYTTTGGKAVKAFSLNDVTVKRTGHVTTSPVLLEDCVASSNTMDAYTSYHSSGTVMMCATWPDVSPASSTKIGTVKVGSNTMRLYKMATGYNDLVVDYDLESDVLDPAASYDFNAMSWKEGMKIVLHIRALGSVLPDKFGLKLENLDNSYVKSNEVKVTLGNYDDAPAGSITAQVAEDDGHPVILVENLQWLLSAANTANNPNATFYNVERESRDIWLATGEDYINHGGELFTVTIKLNGELRTKDNASTLSAQSDQYTAAIIQTTKQNFFMQTTAGNEIHLRGYAPLSTFKTAYAAAIAKDKLKGNVAFLDDGAEYYYCTNWGYPWGIKVPVLTKHVYKDGTIDDAYPSFNEWCVTSGTTNTDWYTESKIDDTYIAKWW